LKNAYRESSSAPFHLLNGHSGEEVPKGVARWRQESGEAQKRGPMRERKEARVFFSFLSWTTTTTTPTLVHFSLRKAILPARSKPLFWSSLSISTWPRWCIVISASLRAGTEAEKRRERAGTRGKEAARRMLQEKNKTRAPRSPKGFFSLSSPCSHSAHPQTPRENRGGPAELVRGGGGRRETATRVGSNANETTLFVFFFEPRESEKKVR